MSTNEDNNEVTEKPVEKKKSKYVTAEELRQEMQTVTTFMGDMAKIADSNQKKAEAELGTITTISNRVENLGTRLESVESVMQKLLNMIQPSQEQPAANVQHHYQRQPIDFTSLFEGASKAADAYEKIKRVHSGEDSEVDVWGRAAGETIKREVVNGLKLITRKAVRRGVIDADIVENIVGEKIVGGSSHEPVL